MSSSFARRRTVCRALASSASRRSSPEIIVRLARAAAAAADASTIVVAGGGTPCEASAGASGAQPGGKAVAPGQRRPTHLVWRGRRSLAAAGPTTAADVAHAPRASGGPAVCRWPNTRARPCAPARRDVGVADVAADVERRPIVRSTLPARGLDAVEAGQAAAAAGVGHGTGEQSPRSVTNASSMPTRVPSTSTPRTNSAQYAPGPRASPVHLEIGKRLTGPSRRSSRRRAWAAQVEDDALAARHGHELVEAARDSASPSKSHDVTMTWTPRSSHLPARRRHAAADLQPAR